MEIKTQASAGFEKAEDCVVTVAPAEGLKISLSSSSARTRDNVLAKINQVVSDLGLTNATVDVLDKGALDYCIEARIITAVRRAGGAL